MIAVMDHSPHDSALHLVHVFREVECDPDEYLNAVMFTYPFTQEGWSMLDYQAGLAFAVEQGWVKRGIMDRICVTAEGLAQPAK